MFLKENKNCTTGTETMEEKMSQQLAVIVHRPLSQVFIDAQKDYDSLDRVRFMEILKGYGLEPNLQILLHQYWYKQKVVLKAGKYLGRRPVQRED